MRKSQKEELLGFIRNMHQAHNEVRAALEKKDIPVIRNMLCDCQDLAIDFGRVVEKLEGEGFITVSYVEQYCEALYHIFEGIQTETINAHKIHKQLEKNLIHIENSVKNDITVRKEVVFFPYKASMWDSLESIYLKFKEDPNTDVFCVPIPYYEVNPDRTLGVMHYEGELYPSDIEIIDWRTYRFEERNPDEIYIHNAYDNWNLVTSVHPRFYSDKLKKHTDKLVYVPYFVMGDIDISNPGVVESKKHFCFMPGIIFADRVILESETVKKLYVSEYLKEAKARGLSGEHIDEKYLNQKFVGSGSPKFDKVKNTELDDVEVPEEWLKIIQKPDGSWKKIIMYNTGITALLKHNEKWVDKIEYALEIFKEHREDVALLWRPHPLIETTMKSMRPEVLQRYEAIKAQYRQEAWGIYDDTAELDRAVVLSGGYYGDMSSVVELCQAKKKQVMIQNVDYLHDVSIENE